MVEPSATPVTTEDRRRVRAWRTRVWTGLAGVGFLAILAPPLLPVPGAGAYAIVLSIYALTFALGFSHYRKPRPIPGASSKRRMSWGMKWAMAIVPAVVILVMSALHPTGRVFDWAVLVMNLLPMFFAGGLFAWRNRVPDKFTT